MGVKEEKNKGEKSKEENLEDINNADKDKNENAKEENTKVEKEGDKEDNEAGKHGGTNVNENKKDNETINDAKVAKATERSSNPSPIEGIDAYRMLMSKAVKRMAEKGLDVRAEQRYETELTFMDEMGFKDKRANIQYLIASCGDLHAALQSMEAKNLAKRKRS